MTHDLRGVAPGGDDAWQAERADAQPRGRASGLAGRGSCAKLHAMSQPKENSHAWTITIVSVLAVLLLYVAGFCGVASYVARHPGDGVPGLGSVLNGLYGWLPQETQFFLIEHVWAKVDPAGWALLDSRI